MSANSFRSTAKAQVIKNLIENGVGLAESTLKRKNLETLEAMYTDLTQAKSDGKVQDLVNSDTNCGGCENGECDNCGNYDCCYDAKGFDEDKTFTEKVNEITGEEDTISEWFESKVGTKWTYIYHNGELIAEVRNDSAKQVMAVLQASAKA